MHITKKLLHWDTEVFNDLILGVWFFRVKLFPANYLACFSLGFIFFLGIELKKNLTNNGSLGFLSLSFSMDLDPITIGRLMFVEHQSTSETKIYSLRRCARAVLLYFERIEITIFKVL